MTKTSVIRAPVCRRCGQQRGSEIAGEIVLPKLGSAGHDPIESFPLRKIIPPLQDNPLGAVVTSCRQNPAFVRSLCNTSMSTCRRPR